MKWYTKTFAFMFVAALALPTFAFAALTTQLDIGDSHADVTELQTFLATEPSIYPEALVTGYFGVLTQAAVERYQCSRSIVCSGSAQTTGYGRVGPTTMARINAELGGGTGGSADVSAPVLANHEITLGSNSATITWTTNEDAFGRVMFSTTWPYLYATAASAASVGFDTAHSVTLSNLLPNTTYYYTRESVDLSGNIQWSSGELFTTQ